MLINYYIPNRAPVKNYQATVDEVKKLSSVPNIRIYNAVSGSAITQANVEEMTKQVIFEQTEESTIWTIHHGKNRIAIPQGVFDDTGEELHYKMTYPDLNTIVLTFPEPKNGVVYID